MPKLDEKTVVEIAAAAAHEANRIYCKSIGDESQLPWGQASEWQKRSARIGVHAIIHSPEFTPQQLHEAWCKTKEQEGWTYGPVKDPGKKTHPCLVSYEALPLEQKYKDMLFGAIVRAVIAACAADD